MDNLNKSVPPIPAQPISRSERWWLWGAIVFGAILRLNFPGRIAIEHFDEGVYASNYWFGGPYPAQHLYAPPLLPMAIEWTIFFAKLIGVKPTGFVPVIPCLIAGIVTIPSAWWIGRRWFGSTAGIVSAWLIATSDFHASYSRAALTDVPVCLFILWATYFIGQAFVRVAMQPLETPSRKKSKTKEIVPPLPWREILLAGGFTGLAWWTKYNGWLPLAIGMAGGTLWQFLTPRPERQIQRLLTCWFMIAATAFVIWSPVLWDLQSHEGGYGAVAANHRGYIVGFRGWGESATRQVEHVGLYENWVGMFTEVFGVSDRLTAEFNRNWASIDILRWLPWPGIPGDSMRLRAERLSVLMNRIATYLIPIIMLILVSIALRFRIWGVKDASDRIGVCLLAAWFCGMTVATPFYHPYPRLVLPWLMAIWIGLGLACQIWRDRTVPKSENLATPIEKSRNPGRIEWLVVVWVIANCAIRSVQGTSYAWRDRTCFEVAAAKIAKSINDKVNDEPVVFVFAEPALVFGLYANGMKNVFPITDFRTVLKPLQKRLPKFLVYGRPSNDFPTIPDILTKLESCEFANQRQIHPSPLVEMDSQNWGLVDWEFPGAPRIYLDRVRE